MLYRGAEAYGALVAQVGADVEDRGIGGSVFLIDWEVLKIMCQLDERYRLAFTKPGSLVAYLLPVWQPIVPFAVPSSRSQWVLVLGRGSRDAVPKIHSCFTWAVRTPLVPAFIVIDCQTSHVIGIWQTLSSSTSHSLVIFQQIHRCIKSFITIIKLDMSVDPLYERRSTYIACTAPSCRPLLPARNPLLRCSIMKIPSAFLLIQIIRLVLLPLLLPVFPHCPRQLTSGPPLGPRRPEAG